LFRADGAGFIYGQQTAAESHAGDAENALPENDGQRKLWVWKMQDCKMTDKLAGTRVSVLSVLTLWLSAVSYTY